MTESLSLLAFARERVTPSATRACCRALRAHTEAQAAQRPGVILLVVIWPVWGVPWHAFWGAGCRAWGPRGTALAACDRVGNGGRIAGGGRRRSGTCAGRVGGGASRCEAGCCVGKGNRLERGVGSVWTSSA